MNRDRAALQTNGFKGATAIAVRQKIFLVEDDLDVANSVRQELEDVGFCVRSYSNQHRVISDAKKERPSLFLLESMLGGSEAFQLCLRIREADAPLARLPVVFLTPDKSKEAGILGLELGGDDYITTPFTTRELVAKIKAVLRRCENPVAQASIQAGDLEINTDAITLKVRGALVSTTPTEFRLLHYLAQHPGQVLTRDQILDAVRGEATLVGPRAVDVYIRRLRGKIERDPENPTYLKTARGAGYRFDIPQS